jgi:hypothetical protein
MSTNFDSCSIGDGTTFFMKKGELSAYSAFIANTISYNTWLDITMQKCEKTLLIWVSIGYKKIKNTKQFLEEKNPKAWKS